MSKQSIEWHQECLANSLASERSMNEQLERMRKACERISGDNIKYRKQINRAIRLKKDAFDRDRFGTGSDE